MPGTDDGPPSGGDGRSPFRHIVVFTVRSGSEIDAGIAVAALAEARPAEVLEWRVARSEDERKGIVLVQNSLFPDRKACAEYRASAGHSALTARMRMLTDWLVVDYPE